MVNKMITVAAKNNNIIRNVYEISLQNVMYINSTHAQLIDKGNSIIQLVSCNKQEEFNSIRLNLIALAK